MPRLITLKISDWLRTGEIAGLTPGTAASEVLAVLGEPPFAGPKQGSPIPGYWRYGEVEFGIAVNGKVSWIQADTVNIGTECPILRIDWEGLNETSSLAACKAWLNQRNFQGAVKRDELGATILLKNGSQLLFADPESPSLATILTSGGMEKAFP